MLLAIDIGNSMVNLGIFEGERLAANLRVSTDAKKSADEYGLTLRDLLVLNGIDPSGITDVCMCSVVPPLTGIFEQLIQTYFKINPLTVTAGVKTGLQINYDNPRDVGADRIVDAVAAIDLYGQPTIIVDFGTATVFDAVSKEGVYLGGSISPEHISTTTGRNGSTGFSYRPEYHRSLAIRLSARLHRVSHRNGGKI